MNKGRWHSRVSSSFKPLRRKPLLFALGFGVVVLAVSIGQKTMLVEREKPQTFLVAPEKAPSRIVVYVIDALRPDHLGLYGYNRDTAPTISALAREGATFTRCFFKTTWTLLSVENIFSGMHGSAYIDDRGAHRVEDCVELLPEYFQEAGWRTGLVTENPFLTQRYNFTQYFEFVGNSSVSGYKDKANWSMETYAHFEGFLEQVKNVPFFLYVHTMEAHSPLVMPDSISPEFTKDTTLKDDLVGWYDSAVHMADQNLANFIALLKERDFYDNTLLIVTADHGETLPGGWSNGIHTGPPFLERVHVPLIVHWPGVVPDGTVFDDLVQQLDLAPTLLNAARLPRPSQFQGDSLITLLTQGNRDSLQNRTMFTVGEDLADRGAASGDRYLLVSKDSATLYDISPNQPWDTPCTEGNEATISHLRDAIESHFSEQRLIFEDYKSSRKWSISGFFHRLFRSKAKNVTINDSPPPQTDEEHKESLEALGYL